MSKGSVLQEMVDRAAVELVRVAAGILGEHAVSPRRGLVRAQLRGGVLIGYLVRGSGGAV